MRTYNTVLNSTEGQDPNALLLTAGELGHSFTFGVFSVLMCRMGTVTLQRVPNRVIMGIM